MSEFQAYYTSDGSQGLYNIRVNDIYHSATGALSEAFDKFVYPIDFNVLKNKSNINILDICYGIGYNTKSFLNYYYKNDLKNTKNFLKFSEKLFFKNKTIDKIYTDNTQGLNRDLSHTLCTYNDTIRNDNNAKQTINITCIDNNEILIGLSPFIKTGYKKWKHVKSEINEKLNKYINIHPLQEYPKIHEYINYFIYETILATNPNIFLNKEFEKIIFDNKYKVFFDDKILSIYKTNKKRNDIINPIWHFVRNLHNIYYQHVSKRLKNGLEHLPLRNTSIDIKTNDAREFIISDNKTYNIIFLDAFTPSKCPCLWSYDFFIQLYQHLATDGIILTYSTSASVRNAMINAGFYIGNTIKNNKTIGTVCAKDKTLIKYPLTDYEQGLLNTTAGIFYRDETLANTNETIIQRRQYEVNSSQLISTTQYKKSFKKVT